MTCETSYRSLFFGSTDVVLSFAAKAVYRPPSLRGTAPSVKLVRYVHFTFVVMLYCSGSLDMAEIQSHYLFNIAFYPRRRERF